MKVATNIRTVKDFGFQLILDESKFVIGVNLLCNKKILIKKRFPEAILISSQIEEIELVNQLIMECFQKENFINKKDKYKEPNLDLFSIFMSGKKSKGFQL